MLSYSLISVSASNMGDAKEWAFCRYYGVERIKHDNVPYDKGSDLDVNDKHFSIKASAFTLMSGNLCEGINDFDGIWTLYASRTHSNTFVYITNDFIAYEMNIDEFKHFVYTFCRIEKESEKNGGTSKIRCKKESSKMIKWLTEKVAA